MAEWTKAGEVADLKVVFGGMPLVAREE